MELELKLAALEGEPLDDARVLAAATTLGRLGPTRVLSLQASYHDDPAGTLRGALWNLRVRAEGDRIVATVKGPGPRVDGLQARAERDATLGRMPREGDPLPAALIDELEQAGVRMTAWPPTRFGTHIRRLAFDLHLPDGRIELALDRGRVEAAGASHPIRELEVELKEGPSRNVVAAALGLAARLRVRPGRRTKAERGLQLRGEWRPAARPPVVSERDAWERLCELEERRGEGAEIDPAEHAAAAAKLGLVGAAGEAGWWPAMWTALGRLSGLPDLPPPGPAPR